MVRYDCLDEYPRFVVVAARSPRSVAEISYALDQLSVSGYGVVHAWASGRNEMLHSIESNAVFGMSPGAVEAVLDVWEEERAKTVPTLRRLVAGVVRFFADWIEGS